MSFSTKRSAWRDLFRKLPCQYEVILKKEFAKQTSTTFLSQKDMAKPFLHSIAPCKGRLKGVICWVLEGALEGKSESP